MWTRNAASVVLALLVTAVSAVPAAAQVNDWPITLKAGLNISNLAFDTAIGVSPDSRTGMLAGVSFSQPIRNGFSTQFEALVTQKGAKLDAFDVFGGTFKARLTYLEIPALARYAVRLNDRSNFHVLAGPSFSFKLSDSQTLDDEDVGETFGVDVAGFDFGFVFGGALEVQKWIVDARFTLGLTNVNDGSEAFPSDIVEAKNRTFSLSLGYRFK